MRSHLAPVWQDRGFVARATYRLDFFAGHEMKSDLQG